ncbi:Acriflavin resistance protein [Minicystis rosea]|nr:Acriflavin resistance protein [Minicystis rosea]
MSGASEEKGRGISRRIAALFVDSKLTPLIIVISLALGALALISTPREQDPTLSVPAVEVTAAWPGHEAAEIDERLGRALSAWMREIATVEHVASTAVDDAAVVRVQFLAGVPDEAAITQVSSRLAAHIGELPAGVQPAIVARGSDDIAILDVVFWSDRDDAATLRRMVREIGRTFERHPNVSTTRVIGGARRELEVRLDPARLAAHGMSAERVVQAVRGSASSFPVGSVDGPEGSFSVRAGLGLRSAADVGSIVLGVAGSKLVRVGDVAEVRDGSGEPDSYVSYIGRETGDATRVAVVLAVQKVRGSNATEITDRIRASLESGAARQILPSHVHYRIARDDGEIAREKVQTLLEHMLIATIVVVLIVGIALGRRAALIVGVVIPVTLAFVPFVYKLAGYTLNRITLAAMIFSIGILVDDAIVIVENVHRHYEAHRKSDGNWVALTLAAVQEVGSPTILATMTVIAALAPTAFTGGMIGQFMRPLPVGASVAMIYSLVIALSLTPFLAYRILRPRDAHGGHGDAHAVVPGWQRAYGRILRFFLAKGSRAAALAGACVLALGGVAALLATRVATFKNLPVSDVDAMAVVVDLPAGTTLEATHRASTGLARELLALPDVVGVETYSGVGGPLNFQGLARGYGMRSAPHQAELQIQLKHRRHATSHQIAGHVRDVAARVLAGVGARFTVAEEPLGPPVQAAFVAEIYAPTPEQRTVIADAVRAELARTTGVVDVDWSEAPPRPGLSMVDDAERLTAHGLASGQAVANLRALLAGTIATELSFPGEPEPVVVNVRVPRHVRATPGDLAGISTLNAEGRPVLAADLSEIRRTQVHAPILRKDLLPVVFVTAEMAGDASAIYAMLDLSRTLPRQPGAAQGVEVLWSDALPTSARGTVRWGGEWTTTFEMNRDLSLAFGIVVLLIYLLLAAWYGSYLTPIVVMLPIPLALVGVVPAHILAHKPLSGMGTIGVIALAGLMVRNSILIVDFAREKLERGAPLREAVALAGDERVRPIVLTAATVVFGDGVLYFDPLLQGLGLTMASGAVGSTILTLVVVPVAYFWSQALLGRRARNETPEEPKQTALGAPAA